MIGWLIGGLAWAGGGGGYVELASGAAWTDFTGPIVRGSCGALSVGAFWGPYTATLQYGRYRRAGLRASVLTAKPLLQSPESILFSVGPEFGGGVDLLRAGAYWRVSVEGAAYLPDDWEESDPIAAGLVVRASAAGVWWATRSIGLVARVEGGPNYSFDEGSRMTLTGGIGFSLLVRGGAVGGRKRREAERAEEVEGFDPQSVPPEG